MPSPRAQQGRPDGWSASTIRAVLERPLYRGTGIYGRSAKAYGRELRGVYRQTTREKGQVPTTKPINPDGLLDGIWSNWVASPTRQPTLYLEGPLAA